MAEPQGETGLNLSDQFFSHEEQRFEEIVAVSYPPELVHNQLGVSADGDRALQLRGEFVEEAEATDDSFVLRHVVASG